jgi:hypothetical protein
VRSNPEARSAGHIPPGRDGLFDPVKTMPATLRYENRIAAAAAIATSVLDQS